MTLTDRFAIGATCFVLGLAGVFQDWPHMGIPIGFGTGWMLVAVWRGAGRKRS
jgi:hypothetical protein